jgi:hypothetical protein
MQQNYKHIPSHSTLVLISTAKKHFVTEWYRITAYILSQKWSLLSHNFLSHLKQLCTLLPYLLRYLSMLSSNLHGGLRKLSSHVLFNIHMQVTCLCRSSQTHCPYRPNIFFHCFTVHFNSLCVMVQLMHLFVIKHYFKCHILKHLKSLQHIFIFLWPCIMISINLL